ncbi:hypothetical protein R50072_35320 [Simiduia litorea]|uniref:NfeD family protein n=1 Tax=Simiduia litorea TaxID=1435348 RepID=UPI0036F3F9C0
MMDYIASHQAEFWLVAGVALLALEVLIGFAAGVFLFAGLGALASGLLMLVGILPETWIAGISATGVSAGVLAALLWQPLKKLQANAVPEKDNSSDLVGHEFVLTTDVSLTVPGQLQYSGVSWRIVLDPACGLKELSAGQTVKVSSVDVGVFKVTPLV